MSSDPLLIVTLLLLIITMGGAVLYYRRIKRAQEEYEDAKGVVKDVIISFNKQLRRQEDKLNTFAHKASDPLKSEDIIRKVEAHDRLLTTVDAKVEGVSGIEQRLLARFEKADERIKDVVMMQKGMMQKIVDLKKLEHTVPLMPKAEIEAVIPIKKEKALAPLTETELRVLEILANEGEKTAPEIMKRTKLSREHTSRLMRRLYENGYLERNTRKAPYVYRLKKEMLTILKKVEF